MTQKEHTQLHQISNELTAAFGEGVRRGTNNAILFLAREAEAAEQQANEYHNRLQEARKMFEKNIEKALEQLKDTQAKLDEALATANRAEMRDEVLFEMSIHVWDAFREKKEWALLLDELNGRIALYTEVLRRTQLFIDTHKDWWDNVEDGSDQGFWETIDEFNESEDAKMQGTAQ